MLRTNSKKAMQNIRNYIVDHYDPTDYDGAPEASDFPTVAHTILDVWYEEYQYSMARYKTFQAAFEDWTRGLPTILDCCYWYNRPAINDLGEILEETEEERNKYDEDTAGSMLSRLMYRELLKGQEMYETGKQEG